MIPDDITNRLKKAEQSIEGAAVLLAKGLADFAASRAYYALFYTAEALLLSKSLTFSKHSAVISGLGQYFTKPGTIDPKFHRYLIEGYEIRQIGDYGASSKISQATAQRVMEQAREFLNVAKDYLKTAT